VPPTYEDALDKPPPHRPRSSKDSSEDSDSALEIQEFQNACDQEDENDADDSFEEDDEDNQCNVETPCNEENSPEAAGNTQNVEKKSSSVEEGESSKDPN
jgi:hypothetical protein